MWIQMHTNIQVVLYEKSDWIMYDENRLWTIKFKTQIVY